MLHHAGVKAVDRAVNRVTKLIKPGVANLRPARHLGAQARHGEATLPIQRLLNAHRRDHRVDQYGARNRWRIRITWCSLARAKNHHLQIHPNLRCRQPRTIGDAHGVKQVGDEQVQRVGIELRNRLRDAKQAGVAHFQDITYCHL